MVEYIEREAALQAQNKSMNLAECRKRLERIPAADVRPVVTDSPYIQAAIDSVIDERKRQINLWGAQYDASMFEFMSILGEEFGELCEAVNETCFKNPKHQERGGVDNVYKEASHVAAVAVKLMEKIESTKADVRSWKEILEREDMREVEA